MTTKRERILALASELDAEGQRELLTFVAQLWARSHLKVLPGGSTGAVAPTETPRPALRRVK